jgi:gliding motility-associated protein GldC
VQLDEQHIPITMHWSASDAGMAAPQACSSMTLTTWDAEQKQLSAISLWTRDAKLADMYAYLSQTLGQLADTCKRATGDDALAARIVACADEVAARARAYAPAEFESAPLANGQEPQETKASQEQGEPISVRD